MRTLYPGAVFVTDDVDHARLSVADLPHLTRLLGCAGCGATRDRHWATAHRDRCASFTRPALPDGHAYLDTLTPGAHIRLRGNPWHGSQRVLSLTPSLPGPTGPLLHLVSDATVVNPPAAHYLSPDTIVELVDPALPTGS